MMMYVALFAALALVIGIAGQVENWRRDLVSNRAETSPDSPDPRLRPLTAPLQVDELASVVRTAASGLAGWRLIAESQLGNEVDLVFERTTRVFRFTDDVKVRIRPVAEGAELFAWSKSRIGKGDLGQNPRNLRELLAAVRRRLEARQL